MLLHHRIAISRPLAVVWALLPLLISLLPQTSRNDQNPQSGTGLQEAAMSASGSPVGSPTNAPVNDGQEEEFQDAVAAADSDRDSDLLSEIDENQFEDYDPETANIEDRPVDIDEDIARTLKASKRKRVDGEVPRKPREGRREKKRRDRDPDVAMDGADDAGMAAPRRARRTGDGERRARAAQASPDPQEDEDLTPEERRKREINRQLDLAIKKPGTNRRRKKDEEVSVDRSTQVYLDGIR